MGNNLSNYDVIRVTPTLDTSEYVSGDVLFHSLEIPNAVYGNGGCSKLVAMFVVSQATTDVDIEFYFSENTLVLGTQNATANVADGTLEAGNITGTIISDASIGKTAGLDNAKIYRVCDAGNGADNFNANPILLQAAAGSTSAYVGAVGLATVTYAADDIDLVFHIQKR
tara:strand:+ start:2136 stop:2642 length:507 start_codon:yes stop_codon:yes gene_type:complete